MQQTPSLQDLEQAFLTIFCKHIEKYNITDNYTRDITARMSTVDDINNKFTGRMVRPDKSVGVAERPVNPFAVKSSQNKDSTFFESLLKPEITSTTKLGADYQGHIVDTKFEDSVRFDGYTINQNPKAGHLLHSVSRLDVEHTREK